MRLIKIISEFKIKIVTMVVLFTAGVLSAGGLLQLMHSYLGQITNGGLVELAILGTVFITSIIAFILISRERSFGSRKNSGEDLSYIIGFDIKLLTAKFIVGFVQGLTKKRNSSLNDLPRK